MKTEQFTRKSFPVDAVQVTAGNMEEVAKWCDGEIKENTESNNPLEPRQDRYIKVRVHNPLTERQTKAFIGDWVLYAGKGYKVYTDKAFRKSFDEQGVPKPQMPVGMVPAKITEVQNVFHQSTDNPGVLGAGEQGAANPGGTHG